METKDSGKQQIIVFKLDEKLYGVDIGQVREITRIGEISPVPNSPAYIKGVTNLRGQVTTVIDLRRRLAMNPKEIGKESRMMVIESEGSSIGMIVDSVAEVTMLSKSDIEETPEIAKTSEGKSSYIKGIGRKEDKLLILVDLNELVDLKTAQEVDITEPMAEETAKSFADNRE